MLPVEDFQDLREEYTISKIKYLEHLILLDAVESREHNNITVVRKQNNADVGLELSNSEIADNQELISHILGETAKKLGYEAVFDVIQQLNPKFRIIAVLEMFYKFEIRAVHMLNNEDTFLLLSTHDIVKVCDIRNLTMRKALQAILDTATGSYVVNRDNYEKSIHAACVLLHETDRASVGFIFHEQRPSQEETNFILDNLNKHGRAECLAFNGCFETEVAEGYPIIYSEEEQQPVLDDESIPLFADDVPISTKKTKPVFTPRFEEQATSTPLDSEDELPF